MSPDLGISLPTLDRIHGFLRRDFGLPTYLQPVGPPLVHSSGVLLFLVFLQFNPKPLKKGEAPTGTTIKFVLRWTYFYIL